VLENLRILTNIKTLIYRRVEAIEKALPEIRKKLAEL